MGPRTYEIISVRDLCAANHVTPAGEPRIAIQKMCPDGQQILIPDLAYGYEVDESAADRACLEADTCVPGPLALQAPEIYFIKDCIIWSQYGLVTVGDHLLKETLFSFPRHLVPEVTLFGETFHEERARLDFSSAPSVSVDNAISMLSGVFENYYHYLMFFLTRLDPSVFYAAQWQSGTGIPCVVAPDGLAAYQTDCLARLCDLFSAPRITLEEKACIRVQNLAIPVLFRNGSLVPHPLIKRSLATLRQCFLPSGSSREARKVYISRRDSNNRILDNQTEIEDLVTAYGFEIVSLTGLSLATQIEIFANASHIIAPHGAGLTNIVFCKVATKILEIHMLSYHNWCYRRLAGLYGLHYGCVWGSSTSPGQHFDTRYYLQPAALTSVLTDPRFAGEW
jgi:hypothetical protein